MYAPSYVWGKILMRLEQQLSEVTVSAWLDDTEVVGLFDNTLVIYSPTDFRQQIIRDRCAPYIIDVLRELLSPDAKLEVWGEAEMRAHKGEKKEKLLQSNPQFTFDNFVAGDSNQLAMKVAKAAAEQPGHEVYNPLFVYGPPGVGKTHLLYAMVNEIVNSFPDLNVVYIRADQFTTELVKAIQSGKTHDFKQKYRKADALLVDDIQFISGKESTQEEFFHTFNELFEHKKQIVMTADRPPSEMATLEDRLRSRFGAGIMIGIDPPDYETRLAITQKKAKQYRLELSEDCLVYIAKTFQDNVRRIEGALKKLRALHALGGVPLTKENVAKFLKDMSGDEKERSVTPALIIRNVCKYYGVEEDTLLGPQRGKGIMEPRQVAMYLIRKMLGVGFNELGKLMKRDHGTVCHGVKKVETALERKTGNLEEIIRDIRSNIESTPY